MGQQKKLWSKITIFHVQIPIHGPDFEHVPFTLYQLTGRGLNVKVSTVDLGLFGFSFVTVVKVGKISLGLTAVRKQWRHWNGRSLQQTHPDTGQNKHTHTHTHVQVQTVTPGSTLDIRVVLITILSLVVTVATSNTMMKANLMSLHKSVVLSLGLFF